MPELPEGTINAFIQNKNLAKYGLLKDNEGGFLAENFVVGQLLLHLLVSWIHVTGPGPPNLKPYGRRSSYPVSHSRE